MEKEEILIRPMCEDDAEKVARLLFQLGYSVSVSQVGERFRQQAADLKRAVLVAENSDAAVVGMIEIHGSFRLITEAYTEIDVLVVDDSARRRGIGRSLVEAAEAWAKEQGYSIILVGSRITREESHPFYEGLGYVRINTQHRYLKNLE